MENSQRYRFGFMLVLLVVVIVSQFVSSSYTQREIDTKMQQYHEALNQNSLLLTALLNRLQEKKIVEKAEVLNEAQKISEDLKALYEKADAQSQKEGTGPTAPGQP